MRHGSKLPGNHVTVSLQFRSKQIKAVVAHGIRDRGPVDIGRRNIVRLPVVARLDQVLELAQEQVSGVKVMCSRLGQASFAGESF